MTAIGGLRVAKGLHEGIWRHAHTLFNEGVIGDVADEQLLELRDTKIQVYGDAAVTIGEQWSNVSKGSPYVVEHGYVAETKTRTWIGRHGTWQCVACQTMVIAPGERDAPAQPRPSAPASK
jgi:hypothetical protein